MSFNTESFKRLADSAKVNKAKIATTAYRGLSASAIVWLYLTFASVKDVDNLRNWVKSISASKVAQIEEIDKRLDAIERNLAFINGRLGLPMTSIPQPTTKTNTP